MHIDLRRFDDFRAALRAEFDCRKKRNAGYSLRSFARDLTVSPGTLSDVLGGKHGLSRAKAAALAKALAMDASDRAHFCDLVDSQSARPATREAARKKLAERTEGGRLRNMRRELFHAISDWHHLALLELASLPKTVADPTVIGRRLGIAREAATAAIARLTELGLVRDVKGYLVPDRSVFKVGGDVPSAAVRKFHAHALEKARAALRDQAVEQREFSTVLLAVSAADMPLAKERIQGFVQAFTEEFSPASAAKDRVYALALQFFDAAP